MERENTVCKTMKTREVSMKHKCIRKMAAARFSSATKRLKLQHRPYRSACEYIHKDDYVAAGEFFKLHIADTHWIDWNNSTCGNRGITMNPDYLLKLFGEICGDKTRDLRREMINHLLINSNYYGKKIVVSLIMNGIDIFDWLSKMAKDTTPLDEIGIFIMSDMLDIHTTVYRRNRLWSTLELKGATETSLIANSELLLVWVEPGRYCILREKHKDRIKPAQLTGHVTIDPTTNNLVYTPWNLSESEVRTAIDALDLTKVKREVIEISDEEKETKTIDLGRIEGYDQLHEMFVDRSPLHSDTEMDSDDEPIEWSRAETINDDLPKNLLIGTTEPLSTEPLTSSDLNISQSEACIGITEKPSQNIGDNELHGATGRISSEELEELRKELVISEDEPDTVLNKSGGSENMLSGATKSKRHTLEDAIWKESANEFLIVDDNILNMPDCTLSIKSLNDREIEIQLDPKPKQIGAPDQTESEKGTESDHEPEKELVNENKGVSDVQTEENEPDKLELEAGVKPKIKIGTGKPRKRTRRKAKSSSESNTPRYSMRIKPTSRRLSSGGCTLRAQCAVNYQENYDYRTGRSREKPKSTPIPPATLSAPTAERQAAQAVIKDPSLLGATPTRTIPVLVLHNNAAEDSDNTVVYDDVEVEGEDPTIPQADLAAQKEQLIPENREAQRKTM